MSFAIVRSEPGLCTGCWRLGQTQRLACFIVLRLDPEVEMIEQAQRFDRIGDGDLSILDPDQVIAVVLLAAIGQIG